MKAAATGAQGEVTASVLLVDDHPANLLALEATLDPLGLRLVRANSGAEALERLLREDFAAIVMDVQMPGLDGFETASLIRQRDRSREIPILFASAIYRDETHIARGYALGAVDYLPKPFDPSVLRAKVAAFADLWRRGESLRRREAALFERERADLLARERAARAEAEADRAHLRGLFMQTSTPIIVMTGPTHVVTLINAGYQEIFGRDREVLGKPLREALPELEGQGFFESLDRVFATGAPAHGSEAPARLDRRGGGALDTAYFNFVYAAYRGADGRVAGVTASAFEVTEQVLARDRAEALRRDLERDAVERDRLSIEVARGAAQLARLQAVTAAFSEALTPAQVAEVAVTQGRAAFEAPRGLVALLAERDATLNVVRTGGYPDEAVAPWHRIPMDFVGPLTDAVRDRVAGFYETPDAVGARYPHLAAERVAGDQALAAIPLVVDGRALGALGLIFTYPRAFDDADRTFMVTLGRQCAQALERARLYEAEADARTAAEAANRAKDAWIMTVSHELRTPLNAILGWTRMLRTGQVPTERREHALEIVERNARSQAQLIEDVLDVSRVVSGKLQLDVRPVELASIVRMAVDSIRPATDARSIHLEVVHDAEVGMIRGDADRLLQVVNNLLVNAAKFTPKGGRIRVDLHRAGGSVELTVVDTGRGIKAGFLPHVFDRFQQQEGGIDRAHGGLGLGLSIVKHLVELHDGTIEARSDGAGRGATFVARFPIPATEDARAGDGPEPDPPTGRSPEGTPDLRGLRALVVDDEEDARELLRVVLEQREVVVTTAAGAAEALDVFWREPPDVLLSDIGMPGETGYGLIRKVRALPADRGGRVPAVALTAYARAVDRADALAAGFDAHLVKPIDHGMLLHEIARLGGRTPGA